MKNELRNSTPKILVIGETIIDQYNFCEVLGKSGKEPMLTFKETKKDQYLGGALSNAGPLFMGRS